MARAISILVAMVIATGAAEINKIDGKPETR